MLTFPQEPQLHEIVSHGTDIWSWDGMKWVKYDKNTSVESVEFYAEKPIEVEATDDEVTYKFNLDHVKKNARLFEFETSIKYTDTGEPYYTFHQSHNDPSDVVLVLTRGMRYVFNQTIDEYKQFPLKFYENKAGTILFGRKPEEFEYQEAIIRDENILTFHPKLDTPDTLLYGAENGTQLGVVYFIDKYN